VEKKFNTKSAAKETLAELLKSPQDTDAQGAFRLQLRKLLEQDGSFVSELAALLESTSSDYRAQVVGGGAIAQGNASKAVGQGGFLIEGNVSGTIFSPGAHKITGSDENNKK
jgi:hypothetical protein